MQWSKVQIEMHGPSGHTPDPLGIATSGLDVGAEQMHEEFLADLPHLDEVRSGHARVVSDISEPTRPLYISYAVFCLKKKTKSET